MNHVSAETGNWMGEISLKEGHYFKTVSLLLIIINNFTP